MDLTNSPYSQPAFHEGVSDIIRRRSTNPRDVRDFLLDGLDLASCHRVLELGCGFGFAATALAPRVAPDAIYHGVDACRANEAPFVSRVEAAGRKPAFLMQRLGSTLPFATGSFDVVIASYSLYFFPEILPEVARVLVPGGHFLALTHSKDVLQDILDDVGQSIAASRLARLSASFSAENGAHRLAAAGFGEVRCTMYPNLLRFPSEFMNDLVTYLCFKVAILAPELCLGPDLERRIRARVLELFTERAVIEVDKQDAAFVARSA